MRGRLPHEDFFYFADTRFLPYGDKPESFLRERGVRIAEALVARGAKALVIACNTATAAAAEAIRAAIGVPVVALEPGVKPAAALSHSGTLGVLATTRTLHSERFQRLVGHHAPGVKVVAQACPGLAEAIENDGPDSPRVGALLDAYVAPLAAAGADVPAARAPARAWRPAWRRSRSPAAIDQRCAASGAVYGRPAMGRKIDGRSLGALTCPHRKNRWPGCVSSNSAR